jgi:hypothetical protein
MAIKYVRFEGKRVSKKWYVVLRHLRKSGVEFTLNSGKRTMREQWALFRKNMRWDGRRWVPKPGRPLTAYPSPTAPHVRLGRADHALDMDNANKVAWHLKHKHGVNPTFPVAGENWHMELPSRELTKLWRELR